MERIDKYIIKADITIVDALKKLDENAGGVLYVADDEYKLKGSLSDGDIRRWILRSGDLKAAVDQVMVREVKKLKRSEINLAEKIAGYYDIPSIPIVDESDRIIEILQMRRKKLEKKRTLSGVSVAIMAGGMGTRLYPYTKILPKPLIPIDGIPILERIMNQFAEYDVNEFNLILNYRKEMIKSYLNDINPPYTICYFEENDPLGTAGGLSLLKDSSNDIIMVTNCDIIIKAEYDKIVEHHKKCNNQLTIVSSLKESVIPYGILHVEEDGVVTSIDEKPTYSNLINTGMYVINKDMLELIPERKMFHMTQLIEKMIESDKRVGMYPVSEQSFLDMGEFEEMKRMEEVLNRSAI